MRSVVVLLAVFGYVCGDVKFKKIYKGGVKLPEDQNAAVGDGWQNVGEMDQNLKITWYKQDGNPVHLAYDKRGGLSGVRVVIPKKGESDFYSKSKIFEELTYDGKTYYISTIYLTDPEFLKKSKTGRRKLKADEIVESITVKHKDSTERIQRNACDNYDQENYLEQLCKPKYGLVFAPLKAESEDCSYPLFLVYNEVEKGEMLGFGWLLPSGDVEGSKALTAAEINKLFISKPGCLSGKAAIEIWLAKEDSLREECEVPNGQFVEQRCNHDRSLRTNHCL